MTRKLALGILLCISSNASAEGPADLPITSFDVSEAVAPISEVQGAGIKVGEGTVLHPVFGLETGFVSNVFYNTEAKPAGMLRLLAQIGTASLSQDRLNPDNTGTATPDEDIVNTGSFQYQANARLAYDQMLSGSDIVNGTGGLGVGADLHGVVNPMSKFSFGFDENFLRSIRAANFETTSNENRDVNHMRLMLLFHQPHGTLGGYLYYKNTIDIFENSGDIYPDRIDHRVGLHPDYRWLPKTQFYGDFSIGYISGLGSSAATATKVDSMPLLLKVGVATLLSLKTAVNVSAGYTNGFYSSGTSYSAPVFNSTVTYRYSPMGRLGLGYSYLHADSVNANYYRDHMIHGFIQQLYVPFAVVVQPQILIRHYDGITILNAPPVRDDLIFQVIAGIHYNFRNWIAATVDYKFSTVQTDYTYMDVTGAQVDLNYVRHELLLGMRVAM